MGLFYVWDPYRNCKESHSVVSGSFATPWTILSWNSLGQRIWVGIQLFSPSHRDLHSPWYVVCILPQFNVLKWGVIFQLLCIFLQMAGFLYYQRPTDVIWVDLKTGGFYKSANIQEKQTPSQSVLHVLKCWSALEGKNHKASAPWRWRQLCSLPRRRKRSRNLIGGVGMVLTVT